MEGAGISGTNPQTLLNHLYVKHGKTKGPKTHNGQDRQGFWKRQCDVDE